ncbi:GDSL-type esterase/lipase family protein [Aeromonas phage ST21]|uniref:GDSL-type esterase/lipase family protein n=1 Tax=Aeromonas phage ST21 TaxID=3065691 RepID=A0AA96ES14_9CAUD|nr:GDSL-type esterase/lipase family protein [Aeromonas phage ST21]
MDNIHPTNYGRMMMGLGNAQAIIGAVNPKGYGAPAFEALPPRMAVGSPAQKPSLRLEGGQIRFSGGLTVASGITNGTKVVGLDPELRPAGWCYFPCVCAGASGITGLGQCAVDPSGNITVYNVPAGSTLVGFDSVVIPLA